MPHLSTHPPPVHYEQAVYGSFAFREQGYAMLAQSPGCRAEWLADFRAACQQVGERPAGVADAAGLFAARLASGPWAIVGMSPQGCDDRGRPGALAFHALFLSPREYRKAGCDPFALAGALRSDWTAAVTALPSATWTPPGEPIEAEIDPRAAAIAAALARGRKVILEVPGPIDALARQVWRRLQPRVRRRATVATWAFANGRRFDLLAVPRLAGVVVDASYLDAAGLDREAVPGPPPALPLGVSRWTVAAIVVVVALAATAIGLVRWGLADRDDMPGPDRPPGPAAVVDPSPSPAAGRGGMPAPSAFAADAAATPAERRRVGEVLEDLADRCGLRSPPGAPADPAELMNVLDRGLRYRGPFLSAYELSALHSQAGSDPAADLALRWHAAVGRFAADRPLPAPDTLRAGLLRWQLAVLAWSFHLDDVATAPGPRRSAAEVAQSLAEALAVDVPLRPNPLTADHPALTSYLSFLGRLPRR
jgi:hypothetical protein